MSAVNITNVTVLDNPTAFLSPFQFEISYECLIPLEDEIGRRRSIEDKSIPRAVLAHASLPPSPTGHSQAVTTLACGSPASRHRPCLRIFSRARRHPPDPTKIREEDIIGVTVLLLTCSYLGQEFLRVGYYVNNDYDDEQLREEPPPRVSVDRVQRNILADKPRVTKFPISFHPDPSENGGQQQQPPVSPESRTDDDPRSIQDSKC
ncbi:hypothetical protein GW17_00005853 [Ensete ventricosum]|nr:hypothetical protein GW17_00005853 [Ensete ventricosum]